MRSIILTLTVVLGLFVASGTAAPAAHINGGDTDRPARPTFNLLAKATEVVAEDVFADATGPAKPRVTSAKGKRSDRAAEIVVED
ncbi:hypothetical protein BGZ95_002501, partial [Linnemannia exigua]